VADGTTPTINITEVVTKYIELRDKKASIMNEAKQKCGQIDAALEKAEAAILAFFNANGMDSAGCTGGTVFKQTRTSATVADWDSFIEFVRKDEAWHMLEHRAAKSAVEEYVAANQDLPPGINWKADVTINVRRA
jgi:hypothetical protein